LIYRLQLAKVRPPPKISIVQWAESRLGLALKDHPWQAGMLEATQDPRVRKSVWIGASQVMGKTHAGNAVIGYHVDYEPCGNMVLQPDLERAEKWMLNKFTPMIRAKCFRDKISTGGRNNPGNTIKYKVFPGGFVSSGGANTAQGLAGDSARVLWADEIDRYKATIGKEGDPLDLFWNRAGSFSDIVQIESSTPTVKGASRIEATWDKSDKRYWHVDCPYCSAHQHLKWKQLDWGERGRGTMERPLYVCENQECDSTWTDEQRVAAIRKGRWIATATFRGIAGFHINGIYSLRRPQRGFETRMHEMVVKFLESKANKEKLKVWTNTFLAESSIEDVEIIEASSVNDRNEKYDADIPDGPLILTFGGDLQKDRIEVELVGHTRNNETWGIENAVFRGNTAKPEVYKEFEKWLSKTWRRADGTVMKIAAGLLDSGHFTNYAYAFCARHRMRNIYPCKGSSTPGSPLVTYSQTKRGLVLVGTEAAKEEIYNSLTITEPGPGYSHFGYREQPDDLGYTDEFFEQLTAEQIEITYHKGHRVRRFTNPHQKRNEALDKRVYALAAKELLNPNWDALAKNLVSTSQPMQPSANEAISAPAAPKAQHPSHFGAPYQMRRPGRSWAKNW
jgi:phage terminase large subunit GpA-like protein